MNYTLERGGKTATVESPRELSPQELSTLSDQYLGAAPQGAKPATPPAASKSPTADELSPLVGGVLDTFGLTNRPGKRTAGGVMLNPQGVAEHLASLAVTVPTIAATGGGAGALGIPATLGRIGASAGLGALSAAERGGDMGWGALLDAAVAGVSEGASKAVTTLPKLGLKAMGSPARAFEWATEAPGKALDFVRHRLPSGKWLSVPSLSGAKLTADEAVRGLAKTTGDTYEVVRAEIADNLNRLDIQKLTGPKPLAGSIFKRQTSRERFEPGMIPRAAEGTRRALDSNAGRSVADALAEQPIEGVPAGLYPLAMAPDYLRGLARKVVPGL